MLHELPLALQPPCSLHASGAWSQARICSHVQPATSLHFNRNSTVVAH